MKTPLEIEKEKKEQRAIRFGQQDASNKLQERVKRFKLVDSNEEAKKRELRKLRFQEQNIANNTQSQQKLQERMKRFGIINPQDEVEKLKLRQQRFGLSALNKQENIEEKKRRFNA